MGEEAKMIGYRVKARRSLTTPETTKKRIKAKRRQRPLWPLSSAATSPLFGIPSGMFYAERVNAGKIDFHH
jgi:hypothetical protein